VRRRFAPVFGEAFPSGAASAGIAGARAAKRDLAARCGHVASCDGQARRPVAPHVGGDPEAYPRARRARPYGTARAHDMMSIAARAPSDRPPADPAARHAGHRVSAPPTADPSAAPDAPLG